MSINTYEDVAGLLSGYSATLRSLRLDCNSPKGDSEILFKTLLSLEKLESLDLADSDFTFDVNALKVSWPLRRLVLGEFLELSVADFSNLVNRFSSTLEILGLDGCPALDPDEEEEEEEEADAKIAQELAANRVNLPKLRVLEITTNHKVQILDWLTSSSTSRIHHLQIGFCPNFEVDRVVAFLEKNRETLRYFEVDVATFSHEEIVKVGAVCEELEIGFVLVSSDFDDFEGGDFDDGDEEWEDED
jgi:hypothetical protein